MFEDFYKISLQFRTIYSSTLEDRISIADLLKKYNMAVILFTIPTQDVSGERCINKQLRNVTFIRII